MAEVTDGNPVPGEDAEDAQWCKLDALPEQMALDHKQNIADALKLKKS